MKQWILVLFLVIGCATYGTFGPDLSIDNIAKRAVKPIMPMVGSGSGIIVYSYEKNSIILTNAHVCAMAKYDGGYLDMIVKLDNDKSYNGEIIRSSSKVDLCIIKIPIGNLPTAKIADEPVKQGDYIMYYGYPYGYRGFFTGHAGGYFKLWRMDFQRAFINAIGGSSGSGIYNKDEEIVGLLSNGIAGIPLVGMVRLQDIKAFLAGKLE